MNDEMLVVVPVEPMEGFTGAFFSPCIEESGKIEMGAEYLSEEDIAEHELLNKPVSTEPSFALVPCGFYEERHGVVPEFN